MSLKSDHRIIPVTGKEQEKQIEDFKGYASGTIRLQPDGWFLTSPFIEFGDKLYDFKFKPNDVLVVTYPKCGTTWVQEIVWTILNNPNLDNPKADLPINVRCPFLEGDFIMKATNSPQIESGNEIYDTFVQLYPDRDPKDGIFLQCAELAPEPRVIKTHLPLSLFKSSLLNVCKIIYMVRNPKDVAVSFHHHSRIFKAHGYVGTLDSFVNHFTNDTLLFSPYWTHVKEAWDRRNHPNLHFCFYEEMEADLKYEITRLQNFLGKHLTKQQTESVVEYTSFSSMKARDNVLGNAAKADNADEGNSMMNVEIMEKDGGFFRNGGSGDWKNKLTEEQAEKIEEWTKKNINDFGPQFKYGKENGINILSAT